MLKETIQVACVPFNARLYNKDELEATLAILSKLHSSDSIIKFHSTSCVDAKIFW
nr:13549_t:CDS:2 [Entrophospora candida]